MEIKDLEPYFRGAKKHIAYAVTVDLYEAIKVHATGDKPDKLLNDYRPSETKEIKDYRLKIHEPVTKEVYSQIRTSLSKIRRSSDWSVKYNEESVPKSIIEEETPERYFEYNYPYLDSLNNWAFSVLLNNYLMDANAVCLIMPIQLDIASNEYLKPYPVIFNSDAVIEYKTDELVILKSNEKAIFNKGKRVYEGDKFYVITKESVQIWEQTAKAYILKSEWLHQLGYLPCFKLRGIIANAFDKEVVWESRINAIIPRLNKVARQDSDLDAGIVTHLYPEAWEYASQPCQTCYEPNSGQSTGKVIVEGKSVGCSACSGSGIVANSGPYKKLVIRPVNTNFGEQPLPTPPKGYINKPIEIIKLQDEIIDKNTYKALSAINMQFLIQTPANQSGYAKDVDRDELNNFIYSIAEDIVWIMDKVYKISIDIRYGLVATLEQRYEMKPSVNVPEKFDILSLNYLMEELGTAIEKKLPPSILNSLLIEFANKKFYNEPEIKDALTLSLKLDPLPAISNDEKAIIKMNNGVSEIDYLISCNITRFISEAIENNEEFGDLGYNEQIKVLRDVATKYKIENSIATEIVSQIG